MAARPGHTDLLYVARQLLRQELIGELPPERKYEALMVANAMAIAAREAHLGRLDLPPQGYLDAIGQLLGEAVPGEDPVRELVGQLRDGGFAAGMTRTRDLHGLLLKEARRRVEISNPRYLDAEPPES
jgi:hypothetical protein